MVNGALTALADQDNTGASQVNDLVRVPTTAETVTASVLEAPDPIGVSHLTAVLDIHTLVVHTTWLLPDKYPTAAVGVVSPIPKFMPFIVNAAP